MTAVKMYREFLDVSQAAQYLQDKGFASCTTQTIKYFAYETDKLPRPTVVGRKAHWNKRDLDLLVEKLYSAT